MAKTPQIPTFTKMMWPTIRALKELGGSGSIQEINERVIKLMNFSEEQQSVLHGDGPETEIQYRLAWVRTYLKKVGVLENSARGVWAITERGRAFKESECATVQAKVQKMDAERRRKRKQQDGAEDEHDEDWRDDLIESLQGMKPDAFERLCQRLLREAGFQNVEVTGRSGDGGIDGTGFYRLSLVSFPVFFQCKRYKDSVGAEKVRDFRGAMAGRGDKGLLIATANFTSGALSEATRQGAPPIDLIDAEKLCDLLREYDLGVSTETRTVEEVTVHPEFFKDI